MKLKKLLPVLWVLIMAFSSYASAGNKVLLVQPTSPEELRLLAEMGASIEGTDSEFGGVRIYVKDELAQRLTQMGYPYEMLIDDVGQFSKSIVREKPPTDGSAVDVRLDHYLTHSEMETYLSDLQTAHSDIMKVYGNGTSTDGYALYAVKISDNVLVDENEPEVFFEGGVHGDEIAAYSLCLYLIETLVENYGAADSQITYIVDNREVWILPATNPDGTFGSPRSRYNGNGVDLNRDQGYMWHFYGGSDAPVGELESQAIFKRYFENQFVFATSFHSGTVLMSLIWSYHYDRPPDWDEADHLGKNYIALNPGMSTWYQGSWGMYVMNGSTKDQGVYASYYVLNCL